MILFCLPRLASAFFSPLGYFDLPQGADEEMKQVSQHRNCMLAVILSAAALIILRGNAAMAMTLNSPAFQQNGHIPSKYTCEGADVSPPLAWEGVPNGAKSLVPIQRSLRIKRTHSFDALRCAE